jgi:hypothetical protein
MKIIATLLLFALTCSLYAQQSYVDPDTLTERILNISEGLLAGYTQPLVDAFSIGISSGLFRSAYSHELLGFDIGINLMYIRVPHSARYFTGTALICSLTTDPIGLVQYEIELENLSTVFGPKDHTNVPVGGNSVAVPPIVPGGFDVAGVPFVIPQLNIGLLLGSEIAIRYVPLTFRGSRVNFQALGIKQQLTKLPPLSLVRLPFAIAVAGAYQRFTVYTTGGQKIIKSKTLNLQVIASTKIGPLEPMFAYCIENTTADINYTFEYVISDTIGGVPIDDWTISEDISMHFKGQYRHRSVLGISLQMGLLFMHYDYNITPYSTHNISLGFTWR